MREIKRYSELADTFRNFLQFQLFPSSLTRSVQSMSVRDNVEDKTPKKARLSPPRSPATIASTRKQTGKSALGLPAITLSEWGFEDIPLPPGPPEPVSR